MKYTIALTLVTYFGCLASPILIAKANSSLSDPVNATKIASAKPIASASMREFDKTITAEAKTYPALVQEAEQLAWQLIQQTFQDNQVQTIVVRVMGDRFGEVAPILTVRVSQAEWQAQPTIQPWARYGGRSSMQLLGYLEPRPPSGEMAAIAATSEVAAPAEAAPLMAPAATSPPATAPSVAPGARARFAPAPGRESPIPGQVPEPSDPGYR